jgi:hypothetical protein
MSIASTRREIARFGWPDTLRALGLRAIGRAADGLMVRAFGLDRPPGDPLPAPRGAAHGFLDEGAIRRLARGTLGALTPEIVADALAHRDRCYGIVAGDTLLGFTWYSRRPTLFEEGLVCTAGGGRVYAYNAWTHPDHRGQRLLATGVTHALTALLAEGCPGLVACVDAENLASVKAWRRMGAADLGAFHVLRNGGRPLVHADARARLGSLRLERGREAPAPSASPSPA